MRHYRWARSGCIFDLHCVRAPLCGSVARESRSASGGNSLRLAYTTTSEGLRDKHSRLCYHVCGRVCECVFFCFVFVFCHVGYIEILEFDEDHEEIEFD